MRILFMGTPDFAVASLKALVEAGHEICGVFTQPDKPKNRGMKMTFSPVKEYALSQNLEVYQPLKMKDGTAFELVKSLAPELIVVAAYGRILPEDILNFPKYGSINVHSSILPKYRGAAPINWAILNGEEETGAAVYKEGRVEYYIHPRADQNFHGTGDMFAACFTGALMQEKSLMQSVKIAADFVCKAIENTCLAPAHWYGVKFETALPDLIRWLNE